jgi:hypothetical protein
MQPEASFVVFPAISAAPPRGWLRWLTPGYRHCFVMRPSALDEQRSIIIEHAGAQLFHTEVPLPIGQAVRDMQARLCAAVLLVILPPAQGLRRLRPPMTCVEATKAVLGLSAPFVLTPRQLARHLRRRHGAVHVLPATA